LKLIQGLKWFVGAVLGLSVIAGIGFCVRPLWFFNHATYLRECLSGAQSRSVQVGGYRLHYVAEGKAAGPPVVLVHGLGGSAEEWSNEAPYLVKAGFRVYMPDLPGYGRSEKPADFSYSVGDEAAVVAGFMDAAGLKQVDLGGSSMGGWIAQLVAARHPQQIRRLMLFDSAGLAEPPDWNTSLFTPQTPGELDQLEALLMPHPSAIPAFVARDVVRFSNQRAWIIRRALATMLSGHDTTDSVLPGLKMPVLIVWGAEDRIMPLRHGETMHRLVPQSEFVVIPGCGHLAQMQCAGQIGPKVVDFLTR
jgi:pimeloyl-ACP methyl ester carboxylesterase